MDVQAPKLSVCPEKQRLSDAVVQASKIIVQLHEREVAALVNGSENIDGFDLELKEGRKRRDEAKAAYVIHTETHGC